MRSSFTARRPRNNRGTMRKGPGQHRSNTLDSSGPDVKVRGNASQIFEKYLVLARDANTQGDRVTAENYLQHADHYYRVLNDNGSGQRSQPRVQPPADGAKPADDAKPAEGATPEQPSEARH